MNALVTAGCGQQVEVRMPRHPPDNVRVIQLARGGVAGQIEHPHVKAFETRYGEALSGRIKTQPCRCAFGANGVHVALRCKIDNRNSSIRAGDSEELSVRAEIDRATG